MGAGNLGGNITGCIGGGFGLGINGTLDKHNITDIIGQIELIAGGLLDKQNKTDAVIGGLGNISGHPIVKPPITDVVGNLESIAESLLDKHNKTGVVAGGLANITGHPIVKPPITDVFGNLESIAEALLDKHNKTDETMPPTNSDPDESLPIVPAAIQSATVRVDRTRTYQPIVGFGGAFTGSVSHLLQQVPAALANTLYTMYYSLSAGIGYTMMRIPIGGCDFDLAPWAYNEQPENDATLSNFYQLDQRDMDRIAQLRQLATVTGNADIKFVGATWSPPPWMKTNNEWSGFGVLRPEYYRTWAEYHLRYLRLMVAQNVRFWAISTGNEPLNGVIGWVFVHFMSLGWTAPTQGRWVGDHLGPLLRNSTLADVKLLGSDDQRYVFPWWFEKMEEAHPDSVNYLDGFAVHWYWDKLAPASLLESTRSKWPDKLILNTESCIGDKPFQTHGPLLGSWDRAEEYIKGYMEDLQHSVNGWIDWNLVLDENGGPNYTNNTVDAPVIVNAGKKRQMFNTCRTFRFDNIHFSNNDFLTFSQPTTSCTSNRCSTRSATSAALCCPTRFGWTCRRSIRPCWPSASSGPIRAWPWCCTTNRVCPLRSRSRTRIARSI